MLAPRCSDVAQQEPLPQSQRRLVVKLTTLAEAAEQCPGIIGKQEIDCPCVGVLAGCPAGLHV